MLALRENLARIVHLHQAGLAILRDRFTPLRDKGREEVRKDHAAGMLLGACRDLVGILGSDEYGRALLGEISANSKTQSVSPLEEPVS